MRARVIDQNVDAVELIENSRHRFFHFPSIGNITSPSEHFRIRRCRLHLRGGLPDGILGDIHNDRIGTVVDQPRRHGGPQSLRPTRDQGDFSG